MSFIINPEYIIGLKTYKCKKDVADFLIYEMGLPVLSISKKKGEKKPYSFAVTDELLSALEKLSERQGEEDNE